MKCVTPMYREYIEYSPERKLELKEAGTKQYQRIVPRSEVAKELDKFPNAITALEDYNEQLKASGSPYRWQTIPCRNCYACQLNYSAEWATRIMCECKQHEHNYFVTLTYDNDHLPILNDISVPHKEFNKWKGENVIKWTKYENVGDEEWGSGSVWEPHMKKFIHDLRQYLDRKYPKTYDENGICTNGMKYYYCAEYGETTHRSHYHIILMNCPLDIKQFREFHIDERYKMHWKTKELEKYWPYGMIDVAEVEWSCAAYVARYCMKKLHQGSKTDDDYAKEGKLKEFTRMSRNIGRSFYEKNKEKIYKYDELIMKTVQGKTGSYKPPKAWDRLYENEHPEHMEMLKLSRQKAAERARTIEKELSDYTDAQRLQMKAEKVIIKAKQLPRVGEWN